MQAITTVGLDIAKSVFQVHGIDAQGQVVGLNGLVITVVGLALIMFFGQSRGSRRS